MALSCRSWQQEGALRMLMNSLDPEVAEEPEALFVSGRAGRPARNWAEFQAILSALRELEADQTLLVRPGEPPQTLRTGSDAPRAVVSGASWSQVGTQGVLPTTYELFAAVARRHFGGTLAGRLVISGGMGGAGGAQPLAATWNGAAFLGIDVDAERIKRRVKMGYCDLLVNHLDEALRILKNAVRKHETASVGLIGNCADLLPELARRGVVPDVLTDQTSADDPAGGYVPAGVATEQAVEWRHRDPGGYRLRVQESIAAHVQGMLDLQKLGAVAFEYGNHIRSLARAHGVAQADDLADGVGTYLQPLCDEGRAPLLWVGLSGDPADIARIDQLARERFPSDEALHRWLSLSSWISRFQGLPARVCWLERSGQASFCADVNELVSRGELQAPVAIVRHTLAGLHPVCAPTISEGGIAAAHRLQATDELASEAELLPEAHGASWVATCPDKNGRAHISEWGVVADGTHAMAQRIHQIFTYSAGANP